MAGAFSAKLEHGIYVYVLFLANLVAFIGLAAITAFMALFLRLTQDTTFVFDGVLYELDTGTIIAFGYAFIAALISLAASWRMHKEEPTPGSLIIVAALQVVAAAAFHSWASILPAIPAVAALYGLALARTASGETGFQAIRNVAQAEQSHQPASASRRVDRYPQAPVVPRDGYPAEGPNTHQPPLTSVADSFAEPARTWACPNCGEENPSDALFCGDCGTRLPEA